MHPEGSHSAKFGHLQGFASVLQLSQTHFISCNCRLPDAEDCPADRKLRYLVSGSIRETPARSSLVDCDVVSA